MTFVPIGAGRIPTSGPGKKGVYYLDFSDDYKNCVKVVRETVEKESRLSELEKKEAAWVEDMKASTLITPPPCLSHTFSFFPFPTHTCSEIVHMNLQPSFKGHTVLLHHFKEYYP